MQSTRLKKIFSQIALIGVALVWGWTFTVVKDAVTTYPTLDFLACRFTIALIFFLPFFLRKREEQRSNARKFYQPLLVGMVLGFAYAFQTWGLRLTTATNCGMITGLFILFTPLCLLVLFRTKVPKIQWLAILASCFGLVLLAQSDSLHLEGDLLALSGALLFGLHIALLGRWSQYWSTLELTVWQIVVAVCVFWLLRLGFTAEPFVLPSGYQLWFALILTGVVATALGFFIQTFSQRVLSPVTVAAILVTEPLFSAIFGAALHGDRLSLVQLGGGAIMFAAMVFVAVDSARSARGEETSIRCGN